jgi:cytochrome c oxidase assembly factor CtaG
MLTAPLAVSTETSAALQIVALAILGALYARRAHTLARGADAVSPRRQACFYGGLVIAAAALVGLGPTGQHLLWVHMLETILLGDLAALAIVLGLTRPLLAPLLRPPLLERLSALSHPLLAFALWAIDLYAWHLRILFQAAMHHSSVQVLEHAMFLGFGINMWMCLFGPLAKPSWFGTGAKLAYVLAVRLSAAALANIFLWSGTIFYPYYLTGEARFHISPIADQNIAGAIMLGEEAIITLCLLYWLLKHADREEKRRTDQLAFARSRAHEMSEAPATRAQAPGRAAELRQPAEGLDGRSEASGALQARSVSCERR